MQQQIQETPSLSASNKYTTSSGRIVKNPTNYPVAGINALQSQKRIRIGAVTRSLISSSSSSGHSYVNVVDAQSTAPSNSAQQIDTVTTVKVTGPTIVPVIKQEPEHFMKVCISLHHINHSHHLFNTLFSMCTFTERDENYNYRRTIDANENY